MSDKQPPFSAAPDSASDRPSPLNRKQIAEVLQYWLALFRYQEALSARPRARQNSAPRGGEANAISLPNIAEPVPGQQYAKLPYTNFESFFVAKTGSLKVDLDVESCGFFEDWLHAMRRRSEDDESPRAGHLVCFPTVLLPRSELAGPLRFSVQANWLTDNNQTFSPAKKGKSAPTTPPCRLRLEPAEKDAEEGLPFFVDAKLLRETLRVEVERLDAFFVELRKKKMLTATAMVNALSVLLENQYAADCSPSAPANSHDAAAPHSHDAILARLQQAVQQRLTQLRSRARCYRVGLLIHSERSRATYHAQRDIQELLEQLPSRTWSERSPLLGYLRGVAVSRAQSKKAEAESGLLRARFSAQGLTPGQLDVARTVRTQSLCAVQGPPGTGKTTLILNLVADNLVRKLLPLLDGYSLGEGVLLITSTNNAAVDNVTEALGSGGQANANHAADSLPLALRLGSREITERVSLADLQASCDWLKRQPLDTGEGYNEALKVFGQSLKDFDAMAHDPTKAPEREVCGHALFNSAKALREAWARKNRSTLLNVIQRAISTAKSSKSLRRMLDSTGGSGPWLRRLYPAWGSTLLSLGNVLPPAPDCVEQVVIDEAGQCHPGYAISALMRARSALIIGDVNQLEPVIGLSREDEQRIVKGLRLKLPLEQLAPYRAHDESNTSAQALADRAVPDRPILIDHFRCQPAIAAICEQLCSYGLISHVAEHSLTAQVPQFTHSVLLHSVLGEQERAMGSWMNAAELEVTVKWVLYLLQRGIRPDDIGVITPFRGQLEALFRALREARVPLADLISVEASASLSLFGTPDRGLAVGTVHRFQGGERSIIILSTTVTRPESLRFVDDRANLINVAASRARHHLLTVGHEATLQRGKHTAALLHDALRV